IRGGEIRSAYPHPIRLRCATPDRPPRKVEVEIACKRKTSLVPGDQEDTPERALLRLTPTRNFLRKFRFRATKRPLDLPLDALQPAQGGGQELWVRLTRAALGGGLVVAEDHQSIFPGAIALFTEEIG